VYTDIRGGSSWPGYQMAVGLSTILHRTRTSDAFLADTICLWPSCTTSAILRCSVHSQSRWTCAADALFLCGSWASCLLMSHANLLVDRWLVISYLELAKLYNAQIDSVHFCIIVHFWFHACRPT